MLLIRFQQELLIIIIPSASEAPTLQNGISTTEEATTTLLAGGMFRVSTTTDATTGNINQLDDLTLPPNNPLCLNWGTELSRLCGLIANRFTTGEWDASEDAEQLLAADAKAVRVMEALKTRKMAKASGATVQYRPTGGAGGESISDGDEEGEEVFDVPDSEEEDDGEDRDVGGSGGEEEKEEEDPTAGFEKVMFHYLYF